MVTLACPKLERVCNQLLRRYRLRCTHSVTNHEILGIFSHFDDIASNIVSERDGIRGFEPVVFVKFPIDGVQRSRLDFDEYLSLTWSRDGKILDLKSAESFSDDECFVSGGQGHWTHDLMKILQYHADIYIYHFAAGLRKLVSN